MESLGKSFKDSFTQTREINAAKEQDAFRMSFDAYMKKKAGYDEALAKDTAFNTTAKNIVSRAGAPTETWTNAYEMLRDGIDPSEVERRIRFTSWNEATALNAPEIPAPPGLGGPEDAITYVSDPGIAPPGATPRPTPGTPTIPMIGAAMPVRPAATPVAPVAPVAPSGGVVPDLLRGFGINLPNPMDEANNRVMSTVGASPEDFARVNAGYSPTITPHRYSAARDRFGEWFPDGTVTDSTLRGAEMRAAAMKASGNPAQIEDAEYYNRVLKPAALLSAVESNPSDTYGNIEPIIKDFVAASTSIGSRTSAIQNVAEKTMELAIRVELNRGILDPIMGAVSFGDDVFRSIQTGIDFAFGPADENRTIPLDELEGMVGDMADAADAALDGKIRGLPLRDAQRATLQEYRLIQSDLYRLTYQLLKAKGETGNDISNRDFQNEFNAVLSSTNPDTFIQNMKNITIDALNSLTNDTREQSRSLDIRRAQLRGNGIHTTPEGAELMATIDRAFISPTEYFNSIDKGNIITWAGEKVNIGGASPRRLGGDAATPATPTIRPPSADAQTVDPIDIIETPDTGMTPDEITLLQGYADRNEPVFIEPHGIVDKDGNILVPRGE